MTDFTVYEKSILIKALIDFKDKVWRLGEMEAEEDQKELLRVLYRDCRAILKKLRQ